VFNETDFVAFAVCGLLFPCVHCCILFCEVCAFVFCVDGLLHAEEDSKVMLHGKLLCCSCDKAA